MPTLHQIEESFQLLNFRLLTSTTPNTKLVLCHQFLTLLHSRERSGHYLSYYQEFYEELFSLITPQHLRFFSPEFLDTFQAHLVRMQQSGLLERHEPSYVNAIRSLEFRRAAVRFYVGDYTTGCAHLGIRNLNFSTLPELDHYQNFHRVLEIVRLSHPKKSDSLEMILAEWQEMAEGLSSDTIWIPLVETNGMTKSEHSPIATLQPLKVELELRKRDAAQDLVFFNNHPLANNDLVYYQAMDAMTAARKYLGLNATRKDGPHFRVIFGFPESGSFYTGESFGLALALAIMVQVDQVFISRTQHRVLKNVVITGGVDVNGQVRRISEHSLQAKLEAFIYSPFRTFIYPEENDTAVKAGHPAEYYPNREYQAIPVRSFSEIVNHPATTRKEKISLREWSKAHSRKNKIVSYLSLLLILTGIIWGSWFFTRDLNPVSLLLREKAVIAYNSGGKELWRIAIPSSDIVNNKGITVYETSKINMVYDLKDIDDDKRNEVVYGVGSRNLAMSGMLRLVDHNGEIVWGKNINHTVRAGEEDYPPPFMIHSIIMLENKQSETRIVTVQRHFLWFPSIVTQLDLKGDVKGEYFHGGHISSTVIEDINNDGVKDISFYGTHNDSLRSAILCVLSLDNIQGCSPSSVSSNKKFDMEVANHLVYLRFPQFTWIRQKENSLFFRVIEFTPTFNKTYHVSAGNKETFQRAEYDLDQNFRVISASLPDNARQKYFDLHGHTIEQDFSPAFIDSALRAVEYYENGKWVASPTTLNN